MADPAVVIERWQGRLAERLAALSEAFDAYRQEAEALVDPAWPSVPQRSAAPPAIDRPPVAEHVLVEAQLLAALLRAWSEAEEERTRVLGVIKGRVGKLNSELEGQRVSQARRGKAERQLAAALRAASGPLSTKAAPPLDLLEASA